MNKEKVKNLLSYIDGYERKEKEYRTARESIEKDIVAEIGKEDLPMKIGRITLNIKNGVLVRS